MSLELIHKYHKTGSKPTKCKFIISNICTPQGGI